MRSIVKAIALSSAIAFATIQPSADAALAPDGIDGLKVATGTFETLAAPRISTRDDDFSNVSAADWPKLAVSDSLAWGVEAPEAMKVSVDFYGLDLPANSTAPKAVEAAKPAVTVLAPEKLDAPQIEIPIPYARPHIPSLRPVEPIDQVKFEGAAGAPFAHVRFCLKYPEECRERNVVFRGGPVKLTDAKRRELARVNAEVNRDIIATQMNEPVAEEKWVISPDRGDCNDYAVTKRHKLIAQGWPASSLLLAEVVVSWGEHHLVVLVRTDKGDLVLDNLNANIVTWTKTRYEWVRVESPVNPKYWQKIAPAATAVASIDRKTSRRM